MSIRFRKILNDSYELNQYPSKEDLHILKLQTGYSEKKIAAWFTKKRFYDSQ